ncbi:MAG: ATP-grasp domain-containing protein [Clostridia bacterium]|jgi:D-alanine-D-alanine ligase|nr:ATP-grasp domain-containing protein [Clostridia bacterium]HOH88874.1 ATP-grasp domain-containing protein [Bacillota bacterium]
MTSKGIIPVLYNEVSEKASKAEIDVIYQVDAVAAALEKLGFTVSRHEFPGNMTETVETLKEMKPLLVFNLVEAVLGQDRLSYLAPSMLEALSIKYTGCPAEAVLLTTNKVVTKKLLRSCGVPTPPWITVHDGGVIAQGEKYIIKAVYEDGSVDLHQDSVVAMENTSQIRELLESMNKKAGKEFFAEKYIEGREINISMLGEKGRPTVLPPSEVKFIGYKEKNMEEILDYRSKWEEDSFEYKNTFSSTSFDSKDYELLKALGEISIECWREFNLKGYARVDFRVDREGRPWVLEINSNPCITPGGSGFINSALQGGLDFKAVIERIISEV